jgi:hypothetical protein
MINNRLTVVILVLEYHNMRKSVNCNACHTTHDAIMNNFENIILLNLKKKSVNYCGQYTELDVIQIPIFEKKMLVVELSFVFLW